MPSPTISTVHYPIRPLSRRSERARVHSCLSIADQSQQSRYYEKTHEFSESVKSSLPIIAVDLPSTFLSQASRQTTWILDDENWKSLLADLETGERQYADTVREGVRKLVKDEKVRMFWLFGLREDRVSHSVSPHPLVSQHIIISAGFSLY